MLQQFADWLICDMCGVSAETHLGQALNFFVYDTTKIFLLLFLISSVMGIINAYMPVEQLRGFLTSKRLFGTQYLLAALFGAITPFCSCSSIPLFIGFVRGGIPLGVTLSFLITSPLINEVAVAMFAATFGWRITLIYIASGILLGTVIGIILERFRLERYLSPWIQQMLQSPPVSADTAVGTPLLPFTKRLPAILKDAWRIVKGVLIYVLIGIAIGAAIHGYVPEDFFAEHLSTDSWYAVPLAVLLAVPMYANAAGVVPIVQVLVSKGVALGTAMAFMMAVVGLSLPEATMLKKVMTWRLIGIFFGSVTLAILLLGYLFNLILG
ncbi:MAG: permease [Paludibacteraceae bacterium]